MHCIFAILDPYKSKLLLVIMDNTMVRKTTAEVKSSTKRTSASTSQSKINSDTFDFEGFFKKIWDGMEENWMTYLWFVLVILGVIQLRQFIVGIAFLTFGILLIAGFFWTHDKK